MTQVANGLQAEFVVEQGDWLAVQQPQPNLREMTAEQLLRQTQDELIVPLRYGRNSQGVVLLGEYPRSAVDESDRKAATVLQRWLHGEADTDAKIDPEEVDCLLAETNLEWTRRDQYWSVSSAAKHSVDVRVQTVPRGLRIEGLLDIASALDSTTRPAVAEFLCRAQLALRFSRLELDESARVVSEIDANSLQWNFVHGVRSVTTACCLLAAEFQALTIPAIAEEYLSVAYRQVEEHAPSQYIT